MKLLLQNNPVEIPHRMNRKPNKETQSKLIDMFNNSEMKFIFWTPEGLSQDPFIYEPIR